MYLVPQTPKTRDWFYFFFFNVLTSNVLKIKILVQTNGREKDLFPLYLEIKVQI